ncbi:zeta toxin family protein [Eggerthella sinensis]|uniref:zeta toxin family protein n=1 Tax=Eggerthella sinensis TaxID=242230 RepID=UPI00266C69F1|nr:zeta toxin family protein [Eggerthella sinensis]
MGNLEDYSDDEFRTEFQTITSMLLVDPLCVPVEHPEAFLLGGQSGAGKTTLHRLLQARLADNAIVVNGDEYRSRHPRFEQISAQYGVDAPARTAAWAGCMVEAVVDALSIMGYNLVIEGTLRTSEVPLKTVQLLHGRGYRVSLALMAVKPEISLVSCQLRYEQMRLAGTEPRAVDPAHHLAIVEGIVGNLATLEESGMFDSVSLYSRSEQCLFSSDDGKGSAHEALASILFGDWTPEERGHLSYLEKRLSEAQGAS